MLPNTASIFGAGPSGFALAADLETRGVGVLVYSHPEHLRHADSILDVSAIGASVTPRVTCDVADAVAFSKTLVLAVPSTAQETLWRELQHFDLRAHVLVAVPGNLFSLVTGAAGKVNALFETNLAPYSCRISDAKLVVFGKKRLCYIAQSTADASGRAAQEMQSLLPMQLHWCCNVVEVCLANINAVFHPLMVLMNAGRIESTAGAFFFYRDGLTQSVANVMLGVDRVRMEIGRAFGFRLESAVEVSNRCYGHDFRSLVDLAQNSRPHRQLRAPNDLENRNLSEDVADLLVCWQGLAEKLGIDPSPITAVIVMAGLATKADFSKTGRNLARLGLDNMSRNELIREYGAPASSKECALL